ncbi:hypothetical protein BHE90_015260 [Fusarium euwallaceae]|uniref:Uncharacterized protein n=4 Tax=Fusarium solani species complex TaxID=232080 RepID=A0A3M2S5F3_9HYPO|nr:hypothetical protein CDV36_007919 [Fusarium kuroshium]RSL80448.1 hypothetical protein CEP51_006574 [Fusarium floridanum]RSM19085.1 hypothetical protein CDV31_002006 [Fusarium ambrosium]RTE70344.1 hypothetical protein BHE90_015260 [Fusarium euwallaceae]
MKGKKEDPNAVPRRGSVPKEPTGLNDEAAVETHDLIHRAEEEEQKMHGSHALTQPDSGPSEGKTGGQQHHSTMEKVKEALHMKK